MEKRLKKVQRGASVGFVLLKILRILLIIAAVAMIAGLVFLAVVNENDLPLDAVKDGKLIIDMQDLDLSQVGLDKVPNIGGLIQDNVLTLDLRDAKLALLLLVGAGVLALVGLYILLLVGGNLFKHMKNEDTPFTSGNIRRLRLLGSLYIVFWVCGLAMSYFVGSEFIRRLALPSDKVSLSLNLSSLLVALLFFFAARIFSFGKAQGEALAAQPVAGFVPEPEPAPVEPAPVAVPAPAPEPVVEPAAEKKPKRTPIGVLFLCNAVLLEPPDGPLHGLPSLAADDAPLLPHETQDFPIGFHGAGLVALDLPDVGDAHGAIGELGGRLERQTLLVQIDGPVILLPLGVDIPQNQGQAPIVLQGLQLF